MKTAQAITPSANGTISEEQLRQAVIAGKDKPKPRTLTAYAASLGVSFQFLGKVISGQYKPGPTIAKALGYEQVVTYSFRKKAAARKSPRKAAKAKK